MRIELQEEVGQTTHIISRDPEHTPGRIRRAAHQPCNVFVCVQNVFKPMYNALSEWAMAHTRK